MPGHGERIIQTYEDWFVRINKRVQRLERRLARVGTTPTPTPPTPTLITNPPGVTGTIWAIKSDDGVVSVWAGTAVTLTSGSFPIGNTDLIASGSGLIPAQYLPTQGGNRYGPVYFAGGFPGLIGINSGGRLQVYNQAGSARSSLQFTITFIP